MASILSQTWQWQMGLQWKKLKGLRNYEGSAFISCEGFP